MGLKDTHLGETCIVIGNGPSLNGVPRELLDSYVTFGSNKIYELPYTPDYYCIIDKDMLGNCLPHIKSGWRPKKQMFLRAEACVEDNYPIYPVVLAGFSLNIDNCVNMGGTVTYALLQIAFWMGFREVLLVGVDHYYGKSNRDGVAGRFKAVGKDPDHFQTKSGVPYFKPGEVYNRPEDTTRSYEWALQYYLEKNATIVNLTPNSKLNVFERGHYEEYIGE